MITKYLVVLEPRRDPVIYEIVVDRETEFFVWMGGKKMGKFKESRRIFDSRIDAICFVMNVRLTMKGAKLVNLPA